jgi:hypothetical protein
MSLASPEHLLEDPELAVLEVLDMLIQQANYALFAAHPELTSGSELDFFCNATPQLLTADAIYNQACALQHAISRYRDICEERRAWPARKSC